MLDTEKWKNDTLYKANYVLNALSHLLTYGLDGTDGWDYDDTLPDVKLGCEQCIYGDEPGDCDYTEILEDAVDVIGELINDNKHLQHQLKEKKKVVVCKDCLNYAPCKENRFHIQGICMRMNQPTDDEYYCADGVRKDESSN